MNVSPLPFRELEPFVQIHAIGFLGVGHITLESKGGIPQRKVLLPCSRSLESAVVHLLGVVIRSRRLRLCRVRVIDQNFWRDIKYLSWYDKTERFYKTMVGNEYVLIHEEAIAESSPPMTVEELLTHSNDRYRILGQYQLKFQRKGTNV